MKKGWVDLDPWTTNRLIAGGLPVEGEPMGGAL
jgi:hypothetical protein